MRLGLNTGKIVPPKLDLDALLSGSDADQVVATKSQVVDTNKPLVVDTKSQVVDTVVATNNESVSTNKVKLVATSKEPVSTDKQVVATTKRRLKVNAYRELIKFRAREGTTELLKIAVQDRGFDDMSDLIRSAIRYALKDPNFKK